MSKPPTRPPFTVNVANTPEEIQECMDIRKEVFIDEQGYDIRIETNDDDARCTHFLLVFESGDAAGTARVFKTDGQLGRVAIRKDYRGMGLGRPLIEAVHAHVKSTGGKEVWCQSQADTKPGGVDATGFYRRLGYVNKGDLYIKEGTIHQDMVFYLA
ncbi:hypothetical protein CI109_107107 [Kwoniella shandongensis]|uniref:Uncharacterized protein n=1 Tax=Kwoniella shandongensis TaxID=1734106 RepID=A0A5M6C777_9TREE|nr:uncharacterized protein CI109_002390 [Kwoniella shandongensis]KAA5529049.1 hypothetical protein CI109_002390 [Kwoniella shandongensis]